MTLDDLIARVEAADGPDRELDAEIGRIAAERFLGYIPPEPQRGCIRYTASLDAAMTLRPEGAVWKVEDHPVYGISAVVQDQQSYAATPALALTAAALRARKETT